MPKVTLNINGFELDVGNALITGVASYIFSQSLGHNVVAFHYLSPVDCARWIAVATLVTTVADSLGQAAAPRKEKKDPYGELAARAISIVAFNSFFYIVASALKKSLQVTSYTLQATILTVNAVYFGIKCLQVIGTQAKEESTKANANPVVNAPDGAVNPVRDRNRRERELLEYRRHPLLPAPGPTHTPTPKKSKNPPKAKTTCLRKTKEDQRDPPASSSPMSPIKIQNSRVMIGTTLQRSKSQQLAKKLTDIFEDYRDSSDETSSSSGLDEEVEEIKFTKVSSRNETPSKKKQLTHSISKVFNNEHLTDPLIDSRLNRQDSSESNQSFPSSDE